MRRLPALTLGMMLVSFLSFTMADEEEDCNDQVAGCTDVNCFDAGEGGVCSWPTTPPLDYPFNHFTADSYMVGTCMPGIFGCKHGSRRCSYPFYQLDPNDFDCEDDVPTCMLTWFDPYT